MSLLHTSFTLRVPGTGFWQNRPWSLGDKPSVKIIFGGDNLDLVADSPFVTKIRPDQKNHDVYFGVAYGNWQDLQALVEWAGRFKWSKALTYHGQEKKLMKQKSKNPLASTSALATRLR
jgi:hypothetical protein